MEVISRRHALRVTSTVLAGPLLATVTQTPASAQLGIPQSVPSRSFQLSTDLMQYLEDQHASIAVKQLSNSVTPDDYKIIAEQWKLLARHFETTNVDTQARSLLPSLLSNSYITHVDESVFYPAIEKAVYSLQKVGLNINRSHFLARVPLPSGDVSEHLSNTISNGLSCQCRQIGDIFASASSNLQAAQMATLHTLQKDSSFYHRLTYKRHKAYIRNASCIWKGDTKQQQYHNCMVGETAIAGLIVGGGVLGCVAIPGCAEALAAANIWSDALAGGLTVAALAGWLISYFCQPILS